MNKTCFKSIATLLFIFLFFSLSANASYYSNEIRISISSNNPYCETGPGEVAVFNFNIFSLEEEPVTVNITAEAYIKGKDDIKNITISNETMNVMPSNGTEPLFHYFFITVE